MDAKTLLLEDIEREHAYLKTKDVGSEEYDKSMNRLDVLMTKLMDLEKFDEEKQDRKKSKIIDIVKFVLNGVISIGVAILILRFEETGSITTALRSLVTSPATKKLL